MESDKRPEEQRSVLLIFKKRDMQNYGDEREKKLVHPTLMIWEGVIKARLKPEMNICELQYGFMQRRTAIDSVFALRSKTVHQKELLCVFVGLKKV